MPPSLEKAVGSENVSEANRVRGAEDFAFYGAKAPAFFFNASGMPLDKMPEQAAPHHMPDFSLTPRVSVST